jgi:drug/metabolite transporter (DMT)-like permease
MWIVYALSAAIIWGMSYAASGRVIDRGLSPLGFFFFYALFGALASGSVLLLTGKAAAVGGEIRGLGTDWTWFLFSVVTSAAGALLIYMAIGEKNATLASLIEISYPLFVAIFAWVFFREVQFNFATAVGAAMILGGVSVIFLSNRH